jgi:hypothetical protein
MTSGFGNKIQYITGDLNTCFPPTMLAALILQFVIYNYTEAQIESQLQFD